jgi:hypothetical protein
MSLSVCVRNVRATSKHGSVTEGNMTCENIDILKSTGYTIEYLDGKPEPDSTSSSFEPIQEIEQIVQEPIIEELPIEAETIQVIKPIYAIHQQDIFDHSLVLAEEITQVKANNIELTNKNNDLKSQLVDVITLEEFNRFKLETQIESVYSSLDSIHANIGVGTRTSEQTRQQFDSYARTVEREELALEEFAKNLGLVYNKRTRVHGEPFYWKEFTDNWTYEKWLVMQSIEGIQ